jgi:outer membrane protein OmpA-like peptidoglycan-associated protein
MIGMWLIAMAIAGSAAAQAPEAQQPIMIFFDSGKAEVKRDWTAALDAVLPLFKQRPDSVIVLDGHSDRAGSALANRRSSLQRAQSVRDYLVARGVPSSAIAINAWGEERPLIATADGVREPQNRRVDVRLTPAPRG